MVFKTKTIKKIEAPDFQKNVIFLKKKSKTATFTHSLMSQKNFNEQI